LFDQHRGAFDAGIDMRRVDRRRAAKAGHGLVVLEQKLVDLAEVIRGDGVVGIDVERLLE
jgi:hypothetical protein